MMEKSIHELAPATICIIFAALAHFDKTPKQCKTDLDRWCYMFKNMGQMPEVPDWVKDRIMLEDFRTKGMIKAARREGREEAVLQTAQKLLQAGVPADIVAKCTSLDLETLKKLSV